jgi:hypothetical protein
MARKRNQQPKSGSGKWTEALDPDEVQATLEDATVDCYDEYEQHSGLLTMVQQELAVPFRARVLGEEVVVVEVEFPNDDAFGLDLVCERGGKRHRVEARSVELIPPLPDGHLYLAAYLAWKRRQ